MSDRPFDYETFYDLDLADTVADLVILAETGRFAKELEAIKDDISALKRDATRENENGK